MITSITTTRFPLGCLVATPSALDHVSPLDRMQALSRHAAADWGDVDPEERAANDQALADGSRLFSVYHTARGTRFYIITERDRSVTTILLPEDY